MHLDFKFFVNKDNANDFNGFRFPSIVIFLPIVSDFFYSI